MFNQTRNAGATLDARTGSAGRIDEAEKNRILTERPEESQIFNLAALTSGYSPIFIVKDRETAMLLATLGHEAIGLGDPLKAEDLRNEIARRKPRSGMIISLPWTGGFPDAADRIRGKLETMGLQYFVTDSENGHCLAIEDGEEKTKEEIKAAVEGLSGEFARKNNVALNMGAFWEEISAARLYPAIKTGFIEFDELLDGGLYPGLYTIGAEPGAGKTAFVMQIADHISASGKDVFVYALEMSRNELIARSCSRLTYIKAMTDPEIRARANKERKRIEWLPKTGREILDGNRFERFTEIEQDLIVTAQKEYTDRSKNLYIIESMANVTAQDIQNDVERWKQATGSAPVVILDYLQILAPMNDRTTDKQNADAAVKILKETARKGRTPVIAISSFNRTSYDDETGFAAFKESGSIEYTSDVLIRLQLPEVMDAGSNEKTKEAKAKAKKEAKKAALSKDQRTVEANIIKNRFAMAETSARFIFLPAFSIYLPEKK